MNNFRKAFLNTFPTSENVSLAVISRALQRLKYTSVQTKQSACVLKKIKK